MLSSTPIIDLHAHPTLKPYGNTFYPNLNPILWGDPSCIWSQDPYTLTDEFFENTLGIPRYREADFTTLVNGQIKLICTALYPIEKGFFEVRQKALAPFEEQIGQFASLLGKNRIEFILGHGAQPYNYFSDLCNEHHYIELLNGKNPIGASRFYEIVLPGDPQNAKAASANLSILPTIEGAHSFCEGTDVNDLANWVNMGANVAAVKKWASPPLFITLAHHFYNGLCTHSKSLFELSGKLLDQSFGMRDFDVTPTDTLMPISKLGYDMIHHLLSKDNGKRIFIDVKHMSLEARLAYYRLLDNEYAGQNIPIIFSHGAVALNKINFYNHEINLDLVKDVPKIYASDGLIGIEIDQRILGYNSNRFIKWIKDIARTEKNKAFIDAEYFWRQAITIAESAYLADKNKNPWRCLCLGSDFDGIINPLNAYRDANSLPTLYRCFVEHLTTYWNSKNSLIPKNFLGSDAQDVAYQVFYQNVFDFIQKYY